MNASFSFAQNISQKSEDLVKEKVKHFDLACNDESEMNVTKFVSKTSESETHFYIASCPSGAYNMSSVLFQENPYSGLTAVPLASPHFNEKTLKVIGWTADVVAGDLSYDPKTKTLTSFSKGRGLDSPLRKVQI